MPTYATPQQWWDRRPKFTAVAASYTATTEDDVIACDTTSGAITITLPPASANPGKVWVVKKTATANAVTISGTETIDGSASLLLYSKNAHVAVIADDSAYTVIELRDGHEWSTGAINTHELWTDGKEIWRKTINVGLMPATATSSTAHGISYTDIIRLEAFMDNGTLWLQLPYVTSNNTNVQVWVNTTNVVVRTQTSSWTTHTGIVTIFYTAA